MYELEELSTTKPVGQQERPNTKILINAPVTWEKKFQLHFPDRYSNLVKQANIDWQDAFIQASASAYQDLSAHIQELFPLVKEGKLAELKNKTITLKDLTESVDCGGMNLLDWARKNQYQQVLDYFYQAIIAPAYSTGTVQPKDAFFFAVVCNQPLTKIAKLALKARDKQDKYIFYPRQRNDSTILHYAIYCNCISAVNFMLKQKEKNDITDKHGCTPFHYAVGNGRAEIVKILLENGVNAQINQADSEGKTPLYYAIRDGNVELVKLLLDNGAMEIIDQPDHFGKTPIHNAIFDVGNDAVIKKLVKRGAQLDLVDNKGKTILHYIAKTPFCSTAKYLLRKGANKVINQRDNKGKTPLHYTAKDKYCNYSMVDLLLKNGADVNVKDREGKTPLHYVIENKNFKLVRCFLNSGAKVDNIENCDKLLEWAVKHRCIDMARALLKNDAIANEVAMRAKNKNDNLMKLLAEEKLKNYIEKNTERQNKGNQYTNAFWSLPGVLPIYTLFGAHSATEKGEAAQQLQRVVNGTAEVSTLTEHESSIKQGGLNTIYQLIVESGLTDAKQQTEYNSWLEKSKPN